MVEFASHLSHVCLQRRISNSRFVVCNTYARACNPDDSHLFEAKFLPHILFSAVKHLWWLRRQRHSWPVASFRIKFAFSKFDLEFQFPHRLKMPRESANMFGNWTWDSSLSEIANGGRIARLQFWKIGKLQRLDSTSNFKHVCTLTRQLQSYRWLANLQGNFNLEVCIQTHMATSMSK